MMKKWPQDDSPVAVTEIVEPLAAAFAHCYHYTPKQEAGAFTYKGYNFGTAETAAGLTPQKLLENPEDPLQAILLAAVGLGIEQGRRKMLDASFVFNEMAVRPSAPLPWPADERKMIDYEDLVKPLLEAVHHFYKLKRVRSSKDVDYQGYDIGRSLKGFTTRSAEVALSAEELRYHQEKGRSAYEMIIRLALEIGEEQGQRLRKQDPAFIAREKAREEYIARMDKLAAELGPITKEERLKMHDSVLQAIARKKKGAPKP